MVASTTEQIVVDIVERILNVVNPKKVFLFGSAVRGTMHDNSDIDLLVVVPDGIHRRKTAQCIYRNLLGLGHAADIVVVTETDVRNSFEGDGYVIRPVLSEGILVYAS
jgi:predicted nucleotidyltransferase